MHHRLVEPGLGPKGVTKSEIQKRVTETARPNAPKTAICCNCRRAADARLPRNRSDPSLEEDAPRGAALSLIAGAQALQNLVDVGCAPRTAC
jgi:hypothetical protein